MYMIRTENNINFSGIKLGNASRLHAKYVKDVLSVNGVDVFGHKTYYISNNFASKQRTMDYVRNANHFYKNECGFIFLPWSNESWIVGNKSFEQKIKKILDKHYIDSEVNLGI